MTYLKSSIYFLLLTSIPVIASAQNDVRLPPNITAQGPTFDVIFRENGTFNLACQAYGVPAPEYSWMHNTFPLNTSNANVELNGGDLLVKGAIKSNQGYYQCIAQNIYGKAYSRTYAVRLAFIVITSDSQTVSEIFVNEGQPLKIPALSYLSHPTPKSEWEIAASVTDGNPRKVVLDERIQIDEKGNLCFAYVKQEDSYNGEKIYKNAITNVQLDIKRGGGYRRLRVQNVNGNLESPPVPLSFSGSETVTAVVGRNLTLECIFAANPTVFVEWGKVDSGAVGAGGIHADRTNFQQFKTKMTIQNIRYSDAGVYTCTGINKLGHYNNTILVDVQAAPTFVDGPHRMKNVNATEGNDVIFSCETDSKPPATVKWYLNGQPIKTKEPPPSFSFDANALELKVREVCRDCKRERSTDLFVIQCNSSNVHGYAYVSAYINVLKRTTVQLEDSDRPRESVRIRSARNLTYNCVGRTDDSTQLKYNWYNVTDPSRVELLAADNQGLFVDGGLLEISVTGNSDRTWLHYGGYYRCEANNGYSKDELTVHIYVEDAPRSVTAEILDMWWLFLIVILAFILVLLCCVCCIFYVTLNKGDKYNVDEKERLNGKDPKKEIEEEDFQDYIRPEGLGVVPTGSLASLAGSSNFGSEIGVDLQNIGTLKSSHESNVFM